MDEQGVPSLWKDTFPEGVDLPEMSNNKQFKETFPQPGHQSYSKSYEWDLKGVVVELNTEELDVMLKTSVAPPAFHHMAKYSLRSEDERNELFEA